VSSAPTKRAPKIDHTRNEPDNPSVSVNWTGPAQAASGGGAEQDAAGEGRDESVAADRDGSLVGEQREGEDGDLLRYLRGPSAFVGEGQ
jgi:hypothetical protein